MKEKGNVEKYGFYNVNYGIYKKIFEETQSNNSFEIGNILCVLNNLSVPFHKHKEYGTKIDITFLSDLLCKSRPTINNYIKQAENYGYIETTLLKNNTKYYKITSKGKNILKIRKK